MIREFTIKHIGIPVAERLKGWPVSRYLNELSELQWWPAERIRELQNARLTALVDHVYRTVPFYTQAMHERRLLPSDIRCVADLPKLPLVTKDDIRRNLDSMISGDFGSADLVHAYSSGSTGEPLHYLMSNDEKARKWAGLCLLWKWAGLEIGDRHVNFVAGPHLAFRSNRFLMYLESKLSGMMTVSALDLYGNNAEAYLKRFVQFRPKVIRGYASSLYYLARTVRKSSLRLKVDAVCTTGETLFDFQRDVIESVFGCNVCDGYGGEGMVIAGQCGHDSGYHINAPSLIVEIVDRNGNACPPGKDGQVVLTDLHRYSMPFIRYNIQDIASLSHRTCSCGRGLPMMERILGRVTDIGVTPSGKSIVVHFFTLLFMRLPTQVKAFQVVQERPDLLVMNIVPGPGFEQVKADILERTIDYVGHDVIVEVELVDDIPLTSAGKRRLFISKCGADAGLLPEFAQDRQPRDAQ